MTYRVWLKRGCHVQIATVRHDGAPDDLAQAVQEQIGSWEIQVAEPMDHLKREGGVMEAKNESTTQEHLFKRLHEDKPEGPFVCCCGWVAWDAEQGMSHLTVMDRAAKLTVREESRTTPR